MSIISIIRGLCESPRESLRDFHSQRSGFCSHPGIRTHKVMCIISIIHIISFISIIHIILIMRIICRFGSILDLLITCGRTRGQRLPRASLLITWAISFVLPCMQGGFHTSIVPTQRMLLTNLTLLWEKASLWSKIESVLLLDAMNKVPSDG